MMKNRKYEKCICVLIGVACIIVVGKCVFQWKERKTFRQQTVSELLDKVDTENKNACKEKEELKENVRNQEALEVSEDSDLTIRVLLTNPQNNSDFHQEVCIQSTGKIEEQSKMQIFDENQPVTVSEMVIENEPLCFSAEHGIQILTMENNNRIPIYEGTLEVYKTEKGYYIVNELDLEQYLKYVVPSEMPSSYPEEALKAQAVCARTYAVRQIKDGRMRDFPAHVDDTVSYQVYNRIDRQTSTDQAVESTKGQILCYQQEPIQAYFFSTSCGYTSTDQVWSGSEETESYLQAISVSKKTVEASANGTIVTENMSDEEKFKTFIRSYGESDYENQESWYRWNVTIPWSTLKKRVTENGWNIGNLEEIHVLQRTSGGAICRLLLNGTNGEYELSNEYAVREFFSPKGYTLFMNDGTNIEGSSLLPSAYLDWDILGEGNDKSIKIYGGGYGHGVGLSQNGAKAMALEGLSWESIISIFFRNVEIFSIGEIA